MGLDMEIKIGDKQLAYWRKEWPLHRWFCERLGIPAGADHGSYLVTTDDLWACLGELSAYARDLVVDSVFKGLEYPEMVLPAIVNTLLAYPFQPGHESALRYVFSY